MSTEPYEPGPELDAALTEAEAREPRLVATVRDLLQDRALLMEELAEAKQQLAESKIRLVQTPRSAEQQDALLSALQRLRDCGLFDVQDCGSESGEWDSLPWAEAKRKAREILEAVEK